MINVEEAEGMLPVVIRIKERKMSHISCPRMKRILFVLPLLLLLALLLVGCGSRNSAIIGSGTATSQAATPSQNGSSSNDATSVETDDQQVQNLLQSLDQAQQDADNANNSSAQDTDQTP
jgi:uncharacterized lipoprotein YajG